VPEEGFINETDIVESYGDDDDKTIRPLEDELDNEKEDSSNCYNTNLLYLQFIIFFMIFSN
jgi:hypothetical protein